MIARNDLELFDALINRTSSPDKLELIKILWGHLHYDDQAEIQGWETVEGDEEGEGDDE